MGGGTGTGGDDGLVAVEFDAGSVPSESRGGRHRGGPVMAAVDIDRINAICDELVTLGISEKAVAPIRAWTKACPECRGRGYTISHFVNGDDIEWTCHACRGTGERS